MTDRFDIMFEGQAIGRAFSSADVKRPGYKNVSLMPLDWTGSFSAGTKKLSVTEFITGSFAVSDDTQTAINELLGQARIEPWKVIVVPVAPPRVVYPVN